MRADTSVQPEIQMQVNDLCGSLDEAKRLYGDILQRIEAHL
jgi:hypothetical protein